MEALEDTFEARLVIHQALHLPMMTDKLQYACNTQSYSLDIPPDQRLSSYRQSERSPCAYVTTHPHPKVDKIVTQPILNSQTPVWDHQCLTHIPNLYLDPQVSILMVHVHCMCEIRLCLLKATEPVMYKASVRYTLILNTSWHSNVTL